MTNTLKSIIIDDEADSREMLAMALERYCPGIAILQVCENAHSGLEAIKTHEPDVVFLDVQMPHMSGFDLLEQVEAIDFEVIFVTAHDKYAIKAIKFSALDYLLKPIDIDDLLQATQKAAKRCQSPQDTDRYTSLLDNAKHHNGKIEKLAIPTQEGILFIQTNEIIYCAADGNYTVIYQAGNKKNIVSKGLKEFEGMLAGSGFCRVHHAYLINLAHIQKYIRGEGGYVVLNEGHHVDVSRRRKEEFMKWIDKV